MAFGLDTSGLRRSIHALVMGTSFWKNRPASKSNAGWKNMSWVQTWPSAKQCWLTNFCGSTVLPCQKCCATGTGMHCGDAVAAADWRWHVANAGITATENHVLWILTLWIQNCLATVFEHPLPPGCLLGACTIRSFLQMPETFSRTYLYKLLKNGTITCCGKASSMSMFGHRVDVWRPHALPTPLVSR